MFWSDQAMSITRFQNKVKVAWVKFWYYTGDLTGCCGKDK